MNYIINSTQINSAIINIFWINHFLVITLQSQLMLYSVCKINAICFSGFRVTRIKKV